MKRSELEHIIRAAGAIAEDDIVASSACRRCPLPRFRGAYVCGWLASR